MIVDGQKLSQQEVRRLVKAFNDECRNVAGEFYDQCRKGLLGDAGRSEKFRTFWTEVGFRCGRDPQVCYVETHYLNFAEDVRKIWAGLLARPDVTERDKETIHKALIVQEVLGLHSQHVPVQLSKDSQQFAGDPFEVKETAKTFGNHVDPSLLSKILGSTRIH
jgi:hypothetical protein